MDHHSLQKHSKILIRPTHESYNIFSPLPQVKQIYRVPIKPIKTALSTFLIAGQSIEDLLLAIRSKPIGPHLPFLRGILHNMTKECPGRPAQPVDMEQICNYLITRKTTTKKDNHDQRQNARLLPELNPGQEVLFLSPADLCDYIKTTIISHTSTPRSYIIESKGKSYYQNHQHICLLHPTITPITRPCLFQTPEPQASTQTTAEQQVTAISGPCSLQDQVPESSSHTVSTFPRPSPSTTE